jgi:hypothetical protein
MRWSFSRLRPAHVALATAAYWIALTALNLSDAIAAAWQVSRLPPTHGSISASLSNTLLQVTIAKDGVSLWSGGASLGALALWIAGPPLLLALTARWTRQVESAGDTGPVGDGSSATTVRLPSPPVEWPTHRGVESETTRVVEPRRRDSGGSSAASRRP